MSSLINSSQYKYNPKFINVKNVVRGSRLISRIGNHSLASQLGKNEALRLPYDFDLKVLEEYKKVSIDDVMSVAEKYCDPGSLIISACGAV
jgi:predicted Zn-dependent peptidase